MSKKKTATKMPPLPGTPGPWMPHPPPLDPSSPAPLEPDSPIEWQEAVNCAHFLLLLDAARGYGLMTGGPEVNAARCTEIVKRGRRIGYKPTAKW